MKDHLENDDLNQDIMPYYDFFVMTENDSFILSWEHKLEGIP